jgi:hypothetical protein
VRRFRKKEQQKKTVDGSNKKNCFRQQRWAIDKKSGEERTRSETSYLVEDGGVEIDKERGREREKANSLGKMNAIKRKSG